MVPMGCIQPCKSLITSKATIMHGIFTRKESLLVGFALKKNITIISGWESWFICLTDFFLGSLQMIVLESCEA